MKINVQKEPAFRKPLPAPPFVIRLSKPEDWFSLLDEYPELEKNWIWHSGGELRDLFYVEPLRFFRAEGGVFKGLVNPHPDWPLMEYP